MQLNLATETEFAFDLPVYLLVRADITDPAEVVGCTLRLGAKGIDTGRQWFVPVFSFEVEAGRFAAGVKKFDDKLRSVEINSLDDWATLLDALRANGDRYVAFDPQPNHVQHVEINGLLAGVRKKLSDGRDPDPASRARDLGTGRSWLRSRLAALRSHPAESGDGRTRPESPSQTAAAAGADDTKLLHSKLTSYRSPAAMLV